MQNCLLLLKGPLLLFSALPLVMLSLFPALNSVEAYEIENRSEVITEETPPADPTWKWTAKAGYRKDDLDWSIAGFTPFGSDVTLDPALQGRYVNVLSELTWRDLEIFQLEFGLEKRIDRRFRLAGQLGIGLIFNGEVQDSDYAGFDRTFEFSRAYADTDDGNTWDVSFGFGYEFTFLSETLALSPLIGLSYHAQNLNITNGFQALSAFGWEATSPTGPFPFLDSTYDASWLGPWIGVEFNARLPKDTQGRFRHEFIVGLEYHLADYYAQANWNLREDFQHPKSFEHEADGSGVVMKLAYQFIFRPPFYLIAEGKYQKWETDSGTDRVFFSNGLIIETPLNAVNWESVAVTVGVGARF